MESCCHGIESTNGAGAKQFSDLASSNNNGKKKKNHKNNARKKKKLKEVRTVLAAVRELLTQEKAEHQADNRNFAAKLHTLEEELKQAKVPCIGKQLGKKCMEEDLELTDVTPKEGVILAAFALAYLRKKMREEGDATLRNYGKTVKALPRSIVDALELKDVYPENKLLGV